MSAVVKLEPIMDTWGSFEQASGIGHIADDESYEHVAGLADVLVDNGAMGEKHPQHSLFMLLADLIYAYDQRHYPQVDVRGVELIRFLMEQHGLRQNQLPEIGAQSVVSDILSGKRELTVNHIRGLSRRFGVNPSAFF